MKKYWLLLIFICIGILNMYAANISFVIATPKQVVKGSQCQLQYILSGDTQSMGNIQVETDDIKGFDILFGPSVSQEYSSSWDNGKSSSQSTCTYTYVLRAKQEGTFTMPAATIVVGGRRYTSNKTTITVLPPDQEQQMRNDAKRQAAMGRKNQQKQQMSDSNNNGRDQVSSTSTANHIKDSDVFIKAIFTKTKVCEQEALVVTYRLYTRLNIQNIGDVKMPEFDGFMTEDIALPENRQIEMMHYKGHNYYTIDIKKSLLFPQRAGKIKIPSGTLGATFEVATGQQEETFFGVENIMADVKKTLNINSEIINVSALPSKNKPESFVNAVGSFKLSANISTQKLKADDPVTLKVMITGTGNMKLIKTPEIVLPSDFDKYDPKVTNSFSTTNDGLSGTKTFEYYFIPRHEGKYTIPEIKFSYFDPNTKSYKTLKTTPYTLDVAKDPNSKLDNNSINFMSQQEVKVIKDIRYIKTEKPHFINVQKYLFSSLLYKLWYVVFLVIFFIGFGIYRNVIKQNANIALMKTKKANKVALKRLKIAKKYLIAQQKEHFFEELLKALWGYLSDKLTMPIANLNRQNIENELMKYGIDEALIKQFINILDHCEFARYAPTDSDTTMASLYDEAIVTIEKMESIIKKNK